MKTEGASRRREIAGPGPKLIQGGDEVEVFLDASRMR